MKVAISNIAWNASEDECVAGLMASRNIVGLEVAPTKIWPDLNTADEESIATWRKWWNTRGIRIVALQSLLFSRPDLNLFAGSAVRRRMLQYLCGAIRISSRLGASVLVFGSPKNRQAGDIHPVSAMDTAVEFFGSLGAMAHAAGVCIGFEPNPAVYGCDFIRTAQEGLQLVKLVDSPGFRLHLDTAILSMNGESMENAVECCFDYLAHVHISEPMLRIVGDGEVDHSTMARVLRSTGYRNWISIEMRCSQTSNTQSVERALDFVTHTYNPAE